jgi:biopolymer transport protein ExbD
MRQSSNGAITNINMTPFVDISLVLLIIFIVTAKLVVTPSVPLDLPQATKSEEVQTILSIIITAEGKVLANGAPIVDEHALIELASSYIKDQPDLRVVIAADGSVAHRKVISVLDSLRIAGISRVAFGISPNNINSKEEK